MTWGVRVVLALYVVGYVVFFWANLNRLEREWPEWREQGYGFLPAALTVAVLSLAWPIAEVTRRIR